MYTTAHLIRVNSISTFKIQVNSSSAFKIRVNSTSPNIIWIPSICHWNRKDRSTHQDTATHSIKKCTAG